MATTTEKDKRRIKEHLTTAQLATKSAYENLLSAGVFASGDRAQMDQIQALQFVVKGVLNEITDVLTKHSEEQG